MVNKNKWSRNQIILLIGVIVSILGLIINFYYLYKNSANQIILTREFDEYKAEYGEFKTLKADIIDANINFSKITGFPISCPDGCAIQFINFSGEYVLCTCFMNESL